MAVNLTGSFLCGRAPPPGSYHRAPVRIRANYVRGQEIEVDGGSRLPASAYRRCGGHGATFDAILAGISTEGQAHVKARRASRPVILIRLPGGQYAATDR